jgi:hypothetical protein
MVVLWSKSRRSGVQAEAEAKADVEAVGPGPELFLRWLIRRFFVASIAL